MTFRFVNKLLLGLISAGIPKDAGDNEDHIEWIENDFPVLYNISKRYEEADIEDKQAIIGSVFSEKLIFEEDQYRTTQPNTIQTLTTATGAALAGLKKKQAREISDLFYSVVPPRIMHHAQTC